MTIGKPIPSPPPARKQPQTGRLPHVARLMVDFSDYQEGLIDFGAYARAGHRVVMAKALEGEGGDGHLLYKPRITAAHEHRLRVLHYHYLLSGINQGRALLEQIKPVFWPGDRLVADVEDPRATVGEVAKWVSDVKRAGHRDLILYTYRAHPNLSQLVKLPFAGIIIADYGTMQRPNLLDTIAARPLPLLGRQFTDGANGPQPHTAAGFGHQPVDQTRLTNPGIKLILQTQP